MSRRIVAVVIVVLVTALGARTVAGGDGDGGGGEPVQRGTATVTRVVDGDTAVLSAVGKSRFIGVDTPEVYGGEECFGAQASAYAKRMLDGRKVRYVVGSEPRDRYGRTLVYLYLDDGRFFNEMLIDAGYARPLAIAPNTQYAGRFAQGAAEAREHGRGLWETC